MALTPDQAQAANEMAEALVGLAEITRSITEYAAGYREQAKTSGFTDAASEQMAVQYHGYLISTLLMGAKK